MAVRLSVAGIVCLSVFVPGGYGSSLTLNGKVVMEDGSAPGRRVSVERVCGGDKPEHIADTNSKGEYYWHATPNRAVSDLNHLTNGSMGNTVLGSTPREICTIRASMPGYESTQIEVQDATALEDPMLPTLTLVQRGSQVDLATSQVSVPHSAASAWNRADREIRKKNWPGAEEQLRAVVAAAPKFARGWEMLGNVLYFAKKPAEAREAYQNAAANDPHRLAPLLMLARLEVDAHDWEATRKTGATLAKADVKKEYPEAYVYQAIAGYYLHDLDNAAASAEEAIRIDKKRNVPRAEYVYGLILQARQDSSGAREHLSRFLELDPRASEAGSARTFLSAIDHPQLAKVQTVEEQIAEVSVALQGVAENLTLNKSSEAWVPGGIAALSAIAHLQQTPSPQDFFTEFCRTMAGEGSLAPLQGIPLYTTTLREYMAIMAELSRMGDRHGDSVTIQLSLAAAERERTDRILQSVGWRVTKSGSGVRVIPGDQPSDSTRLEVLSALGVDAVTMQQALQDGKTFSFEILSEQVRLFGGNSWVELLKDPSLPGGIAAAFTLDIRLAQAYAALSAMEPEAAAALAGSVGLRNLVTRYSATAIHFANAFTVANHVAAVPGGKEAESIWQSLVGAKPGDPAAFFKAVLIKDEGRFANFYWLMSQADSAHQKFFLKDAAKFYGWFRDTAAFHEGVRQMDNPWRANLFRDLPLDDKGNLRLPGGRGAWADASNKSADSLFGVAALEALVPVAILETKRKSPLDETSAKLLSRHYSEWRALFPIFERLPELTGDDFLALERLGESTRTMPRPQQNIVMAEWHALVELMMLGTDAGQHVDPGMFRAICSRLASTDPSAQAVALLRQMAGDGDPDQVVPSRFLHLSGDRLAGFHRVMAFQRVPHVATAKGGAETAAALSGLVYAAALDSNGLLITEDARFLTKHRFAETGFFAEPALVKSSEAPGSYLTGGLMNLSVFGKNLTTGGKPPAVDAIATPVPIGTTAVAGPAPSPVADADAQPADAIFRADSRLVEVFATVTDSGGHYVDDLTADRFKILDSGSKPRIMAFESRSSEVSVALLLDTTGSMRAALPALKSAALRLIEDLREEDSVAVYSFNGAVQELQPFTTDKSLAKRAVLSTHPFGETALYDALTRVGRDLEGRPGKKVMVLFTDGDDNSSTLTTDAAVRRAKAAGIPIYTVAQGSALTNSVFVDQLGAVSKATGGQAFVIHDPQEIKGVFEKVADDLSHGYLLVFQPEATEDPAWRNIEVELQGIKGGKVRARKGYYP